ncbi:MAG: hypothetical protein DLM68_05605 [Hyphomicrobiales bacterium]|nr:MAG: hypothetical protein DLM68_05605 [Hyphomicrobiales bacterium]
MVLFYDGGGSLGGRDPVVSRVDTFESAIEKLGCIAEVLSSLAQSSAEAEARIESAGDRIDRLNAENRALLDDLQQGKW